MLLVGIVRGEFGSPAEVSNQEGRRGLIDTSCIVIIIGHFYR